MKKVLVMFAVIFVTVISLLAVTFARDYSLTADRDLTASWPSSVYIRNQYTNQVYMKCEYTVKETGFLFRKTTFKGEVTGQPNYSRGYVAVTFWIGSDWDYNSSSELVVNEGCYKTSYETSGSNSRPTKVQFYFRDGEYGYTSDYDTYTYIAEQS